MAQFSATRGGAWQEARRRATLAGMTDRDADRETGRRRRPLPELDRERLHQAALAYLERYASSAENLRRVLQRRVLRAARRQPVDEAAARGWIDDIVADLEQAGLLDDRAYAEARVMSLRRGGASLYAVRAKLAQKGVDRDVVDTALERLEQRGPAAALAAAIALARRRRLGPWRTPDARATRRDRDLAALARAGFPLAIARRVVDADAPEALDDLLAEAGEA
jgi:regulatory protein